MFQRLNFLTLFAFALPAIPLAALTLPLYIIVPTFYAEQMGMSLAAIGSALLLVRIFDAINDPMIGFVADRMRFGLGRRRMLFMLSLPLCGLAAIMLFWPPQNVGFGYLALWGIVLTIGYTMCLIPYAAWGAELASDYQERSRIAGFREGFTLIGTLIAIIIPYAIGIDTGEGLHGLAVLGFMVAIALLIFGGLAIWRVPEPEEFSPKRVGFADGLRAMKENKPFARLIIAFFLNGLANGIPASLFLYFVSEWVGQPDLRGGLLFLYFLCGIAGVPLALFIAQRTSKHRAWCGAMLIACAVFVLVPFMPQGMVAPFAAMCVVTGICLGFDLALPSSIQADVIDADTAVTGEQRSGLYFASWSLATKLSLALGVGLVFPILGFFGFIADGSAPQTETGMAALAIAYAWVPVLLKLVAIALMWHFPLDRDMQTELRRQIEG